MNEFIIIYHLAESQMREQFGGLGGAAGPQYCRIACGSMREVAAWLAKTLASDVRGVEIHPIARELVAGEDDG